MWVNGLVYRHKTKHKYRILSVRLRRKTEKADVVNYKEVNTLRRVGSKNFSVNEDEKILSLNFRTVTQRTYERRCSRTNFKRQQIQEEIFNSFYSSDQVTFVFRLVQRTTLHSL